MTIKIFIWILTTISPIYNSHITLNSVETIFEIFFDDLRICYISVGSEYGNIYKNQTGELWINDQIHKDTCSGYKNFVISSNEENLSDTMRQLVTFIPTLSKILIIIISKYQMAKSKELRLIVLANNWDLIVYHEEKQEILNLHPLSTMSSSQHYICLPTRNLICNKNTSNIPHFLQNRPRWNPRRMLRALNRTLKVAIIQNPPYTIINDDSSITGVEIEMLRIIFQNPIEFKVLTVRRLSEIPVSENPWKNITKDLTDKIGGSDIAVCSLWMRIYPHDITYPLEQQCITFIVKRPVLFSETWFVFQNLSLELWGLNMLLILVVIAVFMIFQSGKLPADFFPRYYKGKTVLDVLRTFAGSSMSRTFPDNLILRFLFLLWLLFCLIMVTCYNAGLTTSLKYPKLTEDIRNFQDMIDQNVPWMDETDGVSHFIYSSNDVTAKSLWHLYESEHNKTYRNVKLTKYNYGFRINNLPGGYVGNLEGIDESILKQFKILDGCFAKIHLVMGLKSNSPFKKFFDDNILRLNQHGILNRLYRKFAMMKRSEAMFQLFAPSTGERQETLDFKKLRGAFFLLLVGLLLGFIVFVCETNL